MSTEKKPWYKKTWIWIIVGVVLVVGIVGNLVKDDEEAPTVEETPAAQPEATEPAEVVEETPEPVETAEPQTPTETDEERAARLEHDIKISLGLGDDAPFSDLYASDPNLWGGYINGIRVENGNAYITLQVAPDDAMRDDLGERAAKALSTALSEDMVDGIDWLIVEDAANVVIAQEQPAPIL